MDNSKLASVYTLSKVVNDTLSYANTSVFYAFVPNTYKDYYYRVVRTALQWLDGYVVGFHDTLSGVGSTRLATSIIENLGSKIRGTSFIFRPKNNEKRNQDIARSMTDVWQHKSNFTKALYKAICWSLASGVSFLKLNIKNNELWVDACRQDTLLYTSTSRGKVIDAKMIIRDYVMENSENKETYVIVEHRYFKTLNKDDFGDKKLIIVKDGKNTMYKAGDEIPIVKYEIYKYYGLTLNNQSSTLLGQNDKEPKPINWAEISGKFKELVKRDFNYLRFGEEQILPFKDELGIFAIKNKQGDISINNADFGTSLLNRIQYYLAVYDYAWALRLRDLYLGKGSVLAPKSFTVPMDNDGTKDNAPLTLGGVLDNVLYETYDTDDPSAKPQPIQFSIRNGEWQEALNDCIRRIATTIGVSPKTISPDLIGSLASRKTSTEVEEESERTDDFVNYARQDITFIVNEMLSCALIFMGYDKDACSFDFQKVSANTKERVQTRVLAQLSYGLIDTREALSQLYPEADENRLDEMVKRANEQQERNLLMRDNMLSPTSNIDFDL